MGKKALVELVREGVLPPVDGNVLLRESGTRKYGTILKSDGCRFFYSLEGAQTLAETNFVIYKQVKRTSVKCIFDDLTLPDKPYWEETQVVSFLVERSSLFFDLGPRPVLFFLYSAGENVDLCMAILSRELSFHIFGFSPKASYRALCFQEPKDYFFCNPAVVSSKFTSWSWGFEIKRFLFFLVGCIL